MNSLRAAITAIREEHNTDKKIKMLEKLNDSLPNGVKLQLPSLMTSAYDRTALDIIEERAVVTA
jgi:hypothetical protein